MAEIKNAGKPTKNTVGVLGDVYTDINTGLQYECVNASMIAGVADYTWAKIRTYPAEEAAELIIGATMPKDIISGSVTVLHDDTILGVDQRKFYQCAKLSSVNLPAATNVGVRAFYGCTALTEVNLPAATNIDSEAFYGCVALTSVNIPLVTKIPYSGFRDCSALTSVNAPSVMSINGYAFRNCTALTSIDLPLVATLNSEGSTFYMCKSLTSIDLPSVTDIPNSAFYYCSALTSVNIPLVTTIGYGAFDRCTSLTRIDLPSVISIAESVFRYTSKLENVILRSESVCSLANTNAFNNTPIANGTGYIYVPTTLVDEYKAATNWSTYADQIRAIEDYPEVCG